MCCHKATTQRYYEIAIWLKSFEMIMEKQMIEEEKEEPAEELSDEEHDAMWASILSIYF